MVVRIPDVRCEAVMLSGCCGAESVAAAGGAGPLLTIGTSCPKCRHSFALTAKAPLVCCSATRTLHALTGGGLVKAPQSAPATVSPAWTWTMFAPPPPEEDLRRLAATVRALNISGWYRRNLIWQDGQRVLKEARAAPGTFLVRDSADRSCLFALSVQTDCGPTSVRLQYSRGLFRLDAESGMRTSMPSFECVVALIEHYVSRGDAASRRNVWVDSTGEPCATAYLRRPLRCSPPSLKHLSRLAINGALRASPAPRLPNLPPPHARLPLPVTLVKYLGEYTYSC